MPWTVARLDQSARGPAHRTREPKFGWESAPRSENLGEKRYELANSFFGTELMFQQSITDGKKKKKNKVTVSSGIQEILFFHAI